jgi:hypothetical protein
VIGATVLKGNEVAEMKSRLGNVTLLFPTLVLIIGFSLFVAFFRWHITLYKYKKWIKNVENNLLVRLYDRKPQRGGEYVKGHKSTLYLDDNSPKVTFEGIIIFMLTAMGSLNIGLVYLLLHVFESSQSEKIIMMSISIAVHVFAVLIMKFIKWE